MRDEAQKFLYRVLEEGINPKTVPGRQIPVCVFEPKRLALEFLKTWTGSGKKSVFASAANATSVERSWFLANHDPDRMRIFLVTGIGTLLVNYHFGSIESGTLNSEWMN